MRPHGCLVASPGHRSGTLRRLSRSSETKRGGGPRTQLLPQPWGDENTGTARKPSAIFTNAAVDDETLFVEACESLASASVLVNNLAQLTDGPRRQTMLVLQRVIMLGELAVNRVLDNHKPG